MALGDNTAAFNLIERAMPVIPLDQDAIDGAFPIEILARVAAQTGEPDHAIAALEKLLSIPYESILTVPLTPDIVGYSKMLNS